jgi:hypothetical protein
MAEFLAGSSEPWATILAESEQNLRELLSPDEWMTELLTGAKPNERRGKTMKRPASQATSQSAPEPAATFGPETIETFADAVAERVAARLADRLTGLAGDSAPQSPAGETIGWPAGRLTVNEPEAAALLGMRKHQLRDRRLKGEISCCSPRLSRPVLYTRENLLEFINRAGGTVGKPKLHEPSDATPNESA